MRTMAIIDYDVVRMCPSDIIGWDNRGTKGVRLGQKVLGELVSDLVIMAFYYFEKVTELYIYT